MLGLPSPGRPARAVAGTCPVLCHPGPKKPGWRLAVPSNQVVVVRRASYTVRRTVRRYYFPLNFYFTNYPSNCLGVNALSA